MNGKPLVSVTVVTYNSGRFIRRCLESVLDQTYSFMEVIVVDNSSADGTVDILEPFEDRCTTKKTAASRLPKIKRFRYRRASGY
jgi:glycosyltransferase involved in cell wall biosynthesis